MRELVGIEQRANGDHDPVGDLEAGDPADTPVGVVEDEAGLAVHGGAAVRDPALACLPAPADQCLRHTLRAHERNGDGRRLAAAVSVHRRVRGEQLDQGLGVAVFPGGDEAPRDLVALLARDVVAPPSLVDVPAGAHEDLAARGGAAADDPADLVVRVVEDLVEEEDSPFDR